MTLQRRNYGYDISTRLTCAKSNAMWARISINIVPVIHSIILLIDGAHVWICIHCANPLVLKLPIEHDSTNIIKLHPKQKNAIPINAGTVQWYFVPAYSSKYFMIDCPFVKIPCFAHINRQASSSAIVHIRKRPDSIGHTVIFRSIDDDACMATELGPQPKNLLVVLFVYEFVVCRRLTKQLHFKSKMCAQCAHIIRTSHSTSS